MSTAPHPLAHDPLALLVLEKVRRVGSDRADGQTIRYEGRDYGLTVNKIGVINTVHFVIEALDGPTLGHQRSMVILEILDDGYRGGPGGLDFVLPAMLNGVQVPGHPLKSLSYRVLPCVPVPAVFSATDHDS